MTIYSISRVTAQMVKQYGAKAVGLVPGWRRHVPWMKWREIELIREILRNLRPQSCLEWGSGFSTMYFPRFIPEGSQWLGVEHDEQWCRQIRQLNERPNVWVENVPPDRFPWTGEAQDGGFEDFRSYILFPQRQGNFDFVLVDGRARSHCVAAAAKIISEQGVVVLHDANRPLYQKQYGEFRHQLWFRDHRPTVGGLWIGSIARPLDTVLNIPRQYAIWKTCTAFGETKAGRILRV